MDVKLSCDRRRGHAWASRAAPAVRQAVAADTIGASEEERRLVAPANPPARFEPRHPDRWARAARVNADIAARADAEPQAWTPSPS
jgi:hypothetical protein